MGSEHGRFVGFDRRSAYSWQFHLSASYPHFNDELAARVLSVFRAGFGLPQGWSIEGVRTALARSTAIGLLAAPDVTEYGGYALYLAPEETLLTGWVLWEDAICLRKEFQKRGLSSRALLEASSLFPTREFGWLGGRTQNPMVLKRYQHRSSLVLPIDEGYEGLPGKTVMSFLRQHIAEVREPPGMDQQTGICYAAYKDGRLGDYEIDLTDAEVASIERRLSELGLNRDNGDAVIAMARLNEPLPKKLAFQG